MPETRPESERPGRKRRFLRSSARWLVAVVSLAALMLFAGVARATVSVTITSPKAGAIFNEGVTIEAQITSTYQLQSVNASVASAVGPLTFDSQQNVWSGNLNMAGIASPANVTLTVSATEAFGGTGSASVVVDLDRPPTISVTAPLPGTVGLPSVHVTAQCTDDSGDCVLTIQNAIVSGAQSTHLAMDQDVSTGTGEYAISNFQIDATDGAGQVVGWGAPLYVESFSGLTEVYSAPGVVFDFDRSRVLYASSDAWSHDAVWTQSGLSIHDLGAGTDTSIVAAGSTPVDQRLEPLGAIWFSNASTLNVWTSGTVTTVPGLVVDDPQVTIFAGSWGLFNDANGLVIHDFVTGVDSTVPQNPSAPYALSPTGAAAFGQGANLDTYAPGGSLTTFNAGFCSSPGDLQFDGTNVLAVEFCSSPPSALILISGGQATTLWTGNQGDDPPMVYGQVNNGWTAFDRPTLVGGALEVWTRSPAGETQQVTFTNTDSIVDTLAGDGTVVAASDATLQGAGAESFTPASRFIASGTSPPVAMPLQGKLFWFNGAWYLMLGRTVFGVTPGGGTGGTDAGVGGGGTDASVDGGGTDAGVGEGGADAGGGGVDAGVTPGDGGSDATLPEEAGAVDSGGASDAFAAESGSGSTGSDSSVPFQGDGATQDGTSSTPPPAGDGGGCNASATCSGGAPLVGFGLALLACRRRRKQRRAAAASDART